MLSDGCLWRIKLATSLLQLLYCHDPHRTVRRHSLVCLCFSHGCQFFDVIDPTWFPTSWPGLPFSSSEDSFLFLNWWAISLSSSGTPNLWRIHTWVFLSTNQPEALYATPTTRMILFVLYHLMSSFLILKSYAPHERFHQLFLQFQADIICLPQPNYLVASFAIASPAQISGRVSIEPRYLKRSTWLMIALHCRTSCSFAANRTQHSTIY